MESHFKHILIAYYHAPFLVVVDVFPPACLPACFGRKSYKVLARNIYKCCFLHTILNQLVRPSMSQPARELRPIDWDRLLLLLLSFSHSSILQKIVHFPKSKRTLNGSQPASQPASFCCCCMLFLADETTFSRQSTRD